jgi:hypothetical protein
MCLSVFREFHAHLSGARQPRMIRSPIGCLQDRLLQENVIMDDHKALGIVSALANGVNPLTGEVFPPDSPYQAADIVRALYGCVRALDQNLRRRSRPRAQLPANAGKLWNDEEDRRLLAGFDAGRALTQLAEEHGRTPAGIQARLEKHGRLQTHADGKASWRTRPQPHSAADVSPRAAM